MHSFLRNSGLLILGGILTLPFLLLSLLSLTKSWTYPQLLPEGLSLEQWGNLLKTESGLVFSLMLSVLLSLSVATVATFLGFFISKHLAYHPKKNVLLAFAYFPYLLSPVVYAACLYLYFIKIGASGTFWGVFVAQMLVSLPFSIILFAEHWNLRLKSMEDLVLTMGGSSSQAFWKVLLPLSKGMIVLVFFQTFLISWMEYGLTQLIGVGKVQTLTLQVYLYVQEANPFVAALASCLLVFPPILLLMLNKGLLSKRMELT
jgi:putative spermidine/putrescine transport system permease protein